METSANATTAYTTNKSASYRNRVAVGDRVRFVADDQSGLWVYDEQGKNTWEIDEATRLVIGQVYEGTVRSESNAGFRGIEMTVEIDGMGRYTGISTGSIAR